MVFPQLNVQVLKLKDNKADEDSLREMRDELKLRLTTLEDVTTAAKQVGTYGRKLQASPPFA